MCGLCSRWAGKSCEEEGHVGPEDGETREGGTGISGEPGQHELAEPGAVDGSEDQDQLGTDEVTDPRGVGSLSRIRMIYIDIVKIGCGKSLSSNAI